MIARSALWIGLTALVLLVAPAHAALDSRTNLYANGDFDPARPLPGKRTGISIRTEGDNSWLVVDRPATSAPQQIAIDPEWAALRITLKMRVTDVVVGKESWQDARLTMSFKDKDGKHLSPWPNVFHARGSTDWVRYERVFRIPEGATRLDIAPSMLGDSGKAEFDSIVVTVAATRSGQMVDMPLPAGADEDAELKKAWRQTSPTRETICLNGLWRFLPATGANDLPSENRGWGWFKVPGIWPKSPDGAQQILLPVDLEESDLRKLDQAWYQRPLTVPANWAGRRVQLDFTLVQTHARVLIDGKDAGEVFFPGGTLDITPRVRPGEKQLLSVLLTARPLEAESNVFMAPDRVITAKAEVKNKGLTGDIFLVSSPRESIGDVHVITSTRKNTITLDTSIDSSAAGARTLEARVLDKGQVVKTFRSDRFEARDLKKGRISFTAPWADAKRWDTDTPQNMYSVIVTLRDEAGKVLDESLPIRFGFREFWIEGRDFYLNGSKVHLRVLYTTNIWSEADQSSLEGTRNTCVRMKDYGFNALISSSYNFKAGEVGYIDAVYEATDETGILSSFSLPHIRNFNLKLDDPKVAERYRQQCHWLVRRAQNHPSVVLYAMNHNATGYFSDQNPQRMDGIYSPDEEWAKTYPYKAKNRTQAKIAEAIAREADTSRPIYHHESGNLGDLYTVNIYLNWAPIQERSDWLEHWATKGVMPMFFVEWGLPHISSWSSFRGPEFIWRSPALQQIWDSEFAAPYIGQSAYRMTPTKLKSMALEEDFWAKGQPFLWSHLIRHLLTQDENYAEVQALFAADNWKSHRAWGISAMLPWDQESLWRLPAGAGRKAPVAEPYKGIHEPGIVPDRVAAVTTQYIYSRDVSQIKPSVLGQTFLRWNMPLCAFIGGAPRFTEKSHNLLAGQGISKQLVMLNDTRHPVTCRFAWEIAGTGSRGQGVTQVGAGGTAAASLTATLPEKPGRYVLHATFDFGSEKQTDSLAIDVLPAPLTVTLKSKIALFDPKGQTAAMLKGMGITAQSVDARADLSTFDLLIVGRQALSAETLPFMDRIAKGLKVLVFEQDADALIQLGFRINIHGLRQVYARTPAHPALAGLADANLHDWRGAATLVPPHLEITGLEDYNPRWEWCGFKNTRVWRCGNHGAVASVLIEKPQRGDWLPLADGGFDLQYAPLLEHAAGAGRAIFCQLDVTARSESDPAAERLCANLLTYLDGVKPAQRRKVLYAGDDRTHALLKDLAVAAEKLASQPLDASTLLVVGPGAALPDLRPRIDGGLRLLCVGLNEEELQRILPGTIKAKTQATTSSTIATFDAPVLAGLSNAELHWRTRPVLATLEGGLNEALAVLPIGRGQAVLCQAAPWMFDYAKQPYLRTTYRQNTLLVARLLHNLGAAAEPASDWYTQKPIAEDDPYRYYRW